MSWTGRPEHCPFARAASALAVLSAIGIGVWSLGGSWWGGNPQAGAGDPAQEATASPSVAPAATVTATLVGQASRRLSMPFLSLPATPTRQPATPTPWPKPPVQILTDDILTVAAGDGHAYLASVRELIVVDVREPSRPQLQGRLSLGWPARVEAIDILWLGTRVVVLGIDHSVSPSDRRAVPGSYLATVDVRDPLAPRLLQTLPQQEMAFGLDGTSEAIVLAGSRNGQTCGKADGGLVVYDAGTEGGLTRIACHPLPPEYIGWVAAADQGEVLLTAVWRPDEETSFVAFWFDLVDPRQPVLRGTGAIDTGNLITQVGLQRGRSVIGGWYGPGRLLIADNIRTPSAWRSVESGAFCGLTGIATLDGQWYLRFGQCSDPFLIRSSGQILEPTERGEPARLATDGQVFLQPSDAAAVAWNSVAAADGLVFLADGRHGGILTIVDVRGEGAPRVVGRLD